MDRRDFLKISGAGAVALGTAACAPKKNAPAAEEPEEMVIRTNPRNGDRVSLLGYGCMRWPMIKDADGNDIIDQDAVNEMVDYAMAHGINYYDTSPAYLRGQSERAAGIALSRYPRDSYYIATKLSNFGDNSREASLQMYEDSFKDLQTDYFDYYLFHSIGRGGIEAFNKRYVDNGMLDNANYGANLTTPPTDATASLDKAVWYAVADDSTGTNPTGTVHAQSLRLNLADDTFEVFNLNGKYLGVIKNAARDRISLQESLRRAGLNAGSYLVRGKDSRKMHRVNLQ